MSKLLQIKAIAIATPLFGLAGCHLLSGLDELHVGDGTGGQGGSGGAPTTTTTTQESGGGGQNTGGQGGGVTCGNGRKDGDETDLDCGGADCDPCQDGDSCVVSADCATEICSQAVCVKARAIAAGTAHACALLTDSSLWCWGKNSVGEVGVPVSETEPTPARVPLTGVAQVALGKPLLVTDPAHTCAADDTGHVWCWGSNQNGRLGLGAAPGPFGPTEVPNLSSVLSIAAGGAFSCALSTASEVWCWGAGAAGQMGLGAGPDKTAPESLGALQGASSLALGAEHACVKFPAGTTQCWGQNANGALGTGMATGISTPVQTSTNNLLLVAPARDFTCGATAASVMCWGDNTDGQLGPNGTMPVSAAPTEALAEGVGALAAGGDGSAANGNDPAGGHTCARSAAGKVLCWGNNLRGQLGRGTMSPSEPAPAEVTGLTGAIEIAAGSGFTCAIVASGGVRCWGDNTYGQLGIGMEGEAEWLPQVVTWP